MNLTDHFTLEEMTFSQTAIRKNIPNAPCGVTVNNLIRLCELLEEVRKLIGRPLIISSGYRSPMLNEEVGGAKNSQHLFGCAADFTVKGVLPQEIMEMLVDSEIFYDQLIREYDRWVHISVPNIVDGIPREEALIIDHKGVRPWHP